MSSTFIRNREDFRCEHCGREVQGNGYTNHCPYCLYSKHVDIFPGDRSATCGGLMAPVRVELAQSHRFLVHRCEKCGHQRKNKCAENDSFEALLEIMRAQLPGD